MYSMNWKYINHKNKSVCALISLHCIQTTLLCCLLISWTMWGFHWKMTSRLLARMKLSYPSHHILQCVCVCVRIICTLTGVVVFLLFLPPRWKIKHQNCVRVKNIILLYVAFLSRGAKKTLFKNWTNAKSKPRVCNVLNRV